ncbi:MAG: CPBP family intramembrane metalloprotease [Acidobacteria bacterium]|nr:CPBP family intramembrane metalloprotease [Acidobacteriota bacterium]
MSSEPNAGLERFSRSDWRFLLVCAAVFAVTTTFSVAFFDRAFPEASIEFKVDQRTSRAAAESLLHELGYSQGSRTHAVQFDHDEQAKIFLERSLGLERASGLMRDDVEIWWWSHRWFTPLETEELRVRVSPNGSIVGFERLLEETRATRGIDPEKRVSTAIAFLQKAEIETSDLQLASMSEKKLAKRIDTTVTFERRSVRPGGAPYQYVVTLQGGELGAINQQLRVPEKWTREYASLRSKNGAANDVASVLMSLTAFAALVVFVMRAKRGEVQLRFSLWTAGVCAVLVVLVSLNSFPAALANYDTKSSFAAFVAGEIGIALVAGIALGFFLMVVAGAGDALQRERLPHQLAIPRLFSKTSFRSRRVFLGFTLGFTLVALFLAYQVAFYLIADSLGAWAPAEIPYDDTLNSLFPLAAVLFIGFFPGLSEEYMSRAFSIPFLEKLLRSRLAAIVISAFVWGFAHSAYPNQPFFIRGLEVGFAGVILGFVLYRFGLLPLLVWHYTVDALYTSLLLFRSGNAYYVASAALGTLIFAIPLLVSLVLYIRRGGFVPDGELENGAIGTPMPLETHPEELPRERERDRAPVSRIALTVAAVCAAVGIAIALSLPSPVMRLAANALTPAEATTIARAWLEAGGVHDLPERSAAFPSAGFRSWDDAKGRGGSPGAYDDVAAEHVVRGSRLTTGELSRVMRDDVAGATWKVRFFTPLQKEEYLIEIDPRRREVIAATHVIDDDAPGPSLERERALEIATVELRRHGIDEGSVELKDAVAIPQASRRDWLFHFERKKPIADDVFARTDVRVSGNEITHVGTTVRLTEQARRAATETFGVNTILFFARVAAALILFSLAVSGAVISMRGATPAWKTIIRVTALLAVPALAAESLRLTLAGRDYETSIAWETFLTRQILSMLQGYALELFLVFLCVLVIASRERGVPGLLTLEHRARAGRDAVVRAIAAVAAMLAIIEIDRALGAISRVGIDVAAPVSPLFAIPFPAIDVSWRGIVIAAWLSALSGGYASFVASLRLSKRWLAHAAIVLCIALIVFDHASRPSGMGWAALQALVAGAGIFAIVWFLLVDNPLAALLAGLPWAASDDLVLWFASGRTDLLANGVALSVIIAAAFAWCWTAARRTVKVEALD